MRYEKLDENVPSGDELCPQSEYTEVEESVEEELKEGESAPQAPVPSDQELIELLAKDEPIQSDWI